MIHIEKNDTPEFLVSYVKKNPTATYDSESFKPLHRVLRAELVKEQKGLCAYCCSKITIEDSHNEHIEPRNMKDGTYSMRSLDYSNIVASCNRAGTCGDHKKNVYDEARFVSPLHEDCERFFSYDPDGYMHGDEYTISLLNLNSFGLRRARKSIYKMIMSMDSEDIKMAYCSDSEEYFPYSNVIFWYLRAIEG